MQRMKRKNLKKYIDKDFGPKNDNDEAGNALSLWKTGVADPGYPKPEKVQWNHYDKICKGRQA